MREKALLVISLIWLGGGLWLSSPAFKPKQLARPEAVLGTEAPGLAPLFPVDRVSSELVGFLAKNEIPGTYALLGQDFQSLFPLGVLTASWEPVERSTLIDRPKVQGDWAEAVIELVFKRDNQPKRYLVIFHQENNGWRLFATQDLK